MSANRTVKLASQPSTRRVVRAASAETRAKLIGAAVKEFNQRGYFGTDTNKIARRAGFAPQTFYRWFRDKTEIFLAVYRLWEEQERDMLSKLRLRASKSIAAGRLATAMCREHFVLATLRRKSVV